MRHRVWPYQLFDTVLKKKEALSQVKEKTFPTAGQTTNNICVSLLMSAIKRRFRKGNTASLPQDVNHKLQKHSLVLIDNATA